MSAKVITQVLITGAQIFSRAFLEAYKAASANSKSIVGNDVLSLQTGMDLREAQQILNIDNLEANKTFKHLFDVNDPAKGGSFYLQSKVWRAKERIDLEASRSIEAGKKK